MAENGDKPAPKANLDVMEMRRTFDSFVVGPSNRDAYEAAQAAASGAGSGIRFLCLHGLPGLGATHLLHAIGHALSRNSPHARVVYTTAERFVEEYVDSLRTRNHAAFRKKYEGLDCLLIDDTQFLLKKTRGTEIFYLISQALLQARMVVVPDSSPPTEEMRTIRKSLFGRSRRGLFAELRRPGYRTRLAIARRKAAEQGLDLPDDVAEFLARTLTENVRSLEGGLIQVKAYCELTGSPMTANTAREIFSG